MCLQVFNVHVLLMLTLKNLRSSVLSFRTSFFIAYECLVSFRCSFEFFYFMLVMSVYKYFANFGFLLVLFLALEKLIQKCGCFLFFNYVFPAF